ncbi:hypothetical protein SAMCFNEI73_Ch3467 [Sinorhizobium americanum]|uniref:Uncharacterized protein n=1 Tax=Sinorhizobium americanum TaxID=194963 RepID=A0A1L3LRK4_9HYPH|nr:hypothetical protein SAMCFNEI73_Ch3467 [Sinorhizobium americanum]
MRRRGWQQLRFSLSLRLSAGPLFSPSHLTERITAVQP